MRSIMRSTKFYRFTTFPRLIRTAASAALLSSALVAHAQYGSPQNPGYGDNQSGYSQQDQQADPPSVVGRLSVLQGNISMQSAGVQDFSAAELNYPLTNGDRLYTDNGARGEVQSGQLSVRLGPQTDFTVTALNDQIAQFGLGQGSVHLRTFAFDPNTTTEVDTPNASITLLQAGDTRVDVYPQDNITIVTVLVGQVQVNAEGVQQIVQQGQRLRITGGRPAYADYVNRTRPDDLDRFSSQRDAAYQQAFATEGSYVNPATIGADDLAGYGDWNSSPDYGPVWYPRNVAADWAPYSDGHWVNVAPWGWTWVGAEPWGFAPYHYGRWNRFGDRWGWVPGPQVVRPVYSPALVVFVGGPTFSKGGFSISFGGGSVAAWFPLGPREVYRPWYRSSPVYVNRVNVTNIYNRNTVEVRSIYNERHDMYARRDSDRYVNRSVATVAVPQRDFGGGRSVRESAVRVDQRQYQNAPILNRPPVEAQQQAGARAPARALPPRVERPVLDTRGNGDVNSARGQRGDFNNRRGNQPQGNQGYQPNGGYNPQPGQARPDNNRPAQTGNVQPAQPARDGSQGNGYGGRNNDNRGTDGRFGNERTPVQPAPAAQPAPATQPSPVQPQGNGNGNGNRNGNGYGNGGRFGNGRTPDQPQPAPVAQPAPATQPSPVAVPAQPQGNGNGNRNGNGYGNGGRFGNGRTPDQPQPAPVVQPAPAVQPAPVTAPTQPARDGNGYGSGGRGNSRTPVQPYSAPVTQPAPAPAPVQPVRQQPEPVVQPAVPNGQNEYARPGPRRQAPDAPIQMEQQPRPQRDVQQPRPQREAQPVERPQPVAPQPQQAAPQPRPQPAQQAAPQERRVPAEARPVTPPDDKKK